MPKNKLTKRDFFSIRFRNRKRASQKLVAACTSHNLFALFSWRTFPRPCLFYSSVFQYWFAAPFCRHYVSGSRECSLANGSLFAVVTCLVKAIYESVIKSLHKSDRRIRPLFAIHRVVFNSISFDASPDANIVGNFQRVLHYFINYRYTDEKSR